MQTSYDVIVVGGGAAGMMCAIECGRRGRSVLVIEHNDRIGRKILVSGGGRCNFTNLHSTASNFVSSNPHFLKSALARFSPQDFLNLVRKHGIAFHEKKNGQLFCDGLATSIVRMLESEAQAAGVTLRTGLHLEEVTKGSKFGIRTTIGTFDSASLVVATGGLSFPRLGATDFGYRVARTFGHTIVHPTPALDGFVFTRNEQARFSSLAGISLDAEVRCGQGSFTDGVVFTHVGLSGPAILSASLYWRPEMLVCLNLFPGRNLFHDLIGQKRENPKLKTQTWLSFYLPSRLVEVFCSPFPYSDGRLGETSDRNLEEIVTLFSKWEFTPERTTGFNRAEVTRGGINTSELSSQTMESKLVPGLYFVGEVVDVTGELGGHNFQWAWASGFAAGQVA